MTIETKQDRDELAEIEELVRDQSELPPPREPVTHKLSPELENEKTWFLICVVATTVCVVVLAFVLTF